MAGRFRVTGELEGDKAKYRLEDESTGSLSGTVEIGELSAWIKLMDASGNEVSRKQVSIADTTPLSLQKALRRFLAEEKPGESYQFADVPTSADVDGEALVVSADALMDYGEDSEEEDDSEDESEEEDDSEDESEEQ